MRELELTWGQVVRIWWAALWRGIILANLIAGIYAATVALVLFVVKHRNWTNSDWLFNGILVVFIIAFIPAIRLALKAPYKGFRLAIIATVEAPVES